MLLAETAKIGRLIGFATTESEDLLELRASSSPETNEGASLDIGEDFGEAISRTLVDSTPSKRFEVDKSQLAERPVENDQLPAGRFSPPRSGITDVNRGSDNPSASKPRTKKRKTQKGGNIIDDLFRGL